MSNENGTQRGEMGTPGPQRLLGAVHILGCFPYPFPPQELRHQGEDSDQGWMRSFPPLTAPIPPPRVTPAPEEFSLPLPSPAPQEKRERGSASAEPTPPAPMASVRPLQSAARPQLAWCPRAPITPSITALEAAEGREGEG